MAKKIKSKIKKKSSVNPLEGKEVKKIKIKVVGLGGGGGNIVSEIASRITKASFLAVNTDLKSLKSCNKKIAKFQLGQDLTQGLGTGMNPELGKLAAENEKEKIKSLLRGFDLSILVTSLGGGTGSGAISTFAKISKSLGNLTYGIFTLPFQFEGERKMEIALNALEEARSYFNAITLIPNERVFQVVNKDTPLKEALSAINKFLAENLGGLIETIYDPGLINIDFADFKTIFEGKGRLVYLNTIESLDKEKRIKDLAENAFKSPFYPYTIRGAKGVLFNILGEKNLSLAEVNEISKIISGLVHPEAKIIFGVSQKTKANSGIKTIILAMGCGSGEEGIKPSSKKRVKKVGEKEKIKPVKTKAVKKKIKEVEKKPKIEKKEKGVVKEKVGEVRKNGLQVKKEVEEIEKEMIKKEKYWETPAFLRKDFKNY